MAAATSAALAAVTAVSLELLRLSVDIISIASAIGTTPPQSQSQSQTQLQSQSSNSSNPTTGRGTSNHGTSSNHNSTHHSHHHASSSNNSNNHSHNNVKNPPAPAKSSSGSVPTSAASSTHGGGDESASDYRPLLSPDEENQNSDNDNNNNATNPHYHAQLRFHTFLWGYITLALVLGVTLIVALVQHCFSHLLASVYPKSLLIGAALVLVVELLYHCMDADKVRYGSFARLLRFTALFLLWGQFLFQFLKYHSHYHNHHHHQDHHDDPSPSSAPSLSPSPSPSSLSSSSFSLSSSSSTEVPNLYVMGLILLLDVSALLVLACVDTLLVYQSPSPARRQALEEAAKKPALSRAALLTMVKPYVWPDATSESALWNRVRAIATWVCVILSKLCNLVTPLLLGRASTALAHQDYHGTIRLSILYSVLAWLGATFQEGQFLFYLKVGQDAFVQLSEASFRHLHHLSLDWHLRKKMGEVLRSMDRGITACDTLMKYLFLRLLPALAECFLVTVIFATYFQYFPLAVTVFYFVFAYIVWTIVVTLWRKKFRRALVKHDNDWHDLFTDSMINFETVKHYTAEEFELQRFRDAVNKYQVGSVHVQGSLSFLNVSQKLLFQVCMASSLSLAAWGIQQRVSCCMETGGCDSAISECCRNVSRDVCPGMEVGDFVAVLSYLVNLFTPLDFLGSIYNAVVMALIDLANLSELLAEHPDVVDVQGSVELPRTNAQDPDTAVEFDNVIFHYPTQPENSGLKGISFKMKRGSTTAIVGSTGAGKTTIGRLLFRFYDVLGGAVRINGLDVRSVTQKSLRGAIGVVPQATSMFNDTLRSNLLYGRRDATEEELIQAARDAQLLDFIETLPEGWETVVGDRGLKLSGGEKQRAAIARCLLKNPPFVLLDEATSALDTLTESSVQEALDRLGQERTVLVIAHRLSTIRNADKIIVLKEGKIAEEGTHDELLSANGVYADMWNIQLRDSKSLAPN